MVNYFTFNMENWLLKNIINGMRRYNGGSQGLLLALFSGITLSSTLGTIWDDWDPTWVCHLKDRCPTHCILPSSSLSQRSSDSLNYSTAGIRAQPMNSQYYYICLELRHCVS